MTSKVLFSADYPIYSVGRLGRDDTELYVTGGGGKSRTGTPNALDVYKLSCEGGECVSVPVHHHDMETSVIMNSASHPKKSGRLAVGVGGECLTLEITAVDKTSTKEGKVKVKVRRRKKSQTSDEDSSVNSGQSRMVIELARVQTDFSDECYQRVVSFTSDGGRVVTGGSDAVIRVWEYPSLKKVCEFKGHGNEIETLTCHPSQQQVVSVCRKGVAMVWDIGSQSEEHTFTWSPGQRANDDVAKPPSYRFRACCFSPKMAEQDHISLYTLSIPVSRHGKQSCYVVKWDAGVWLVEEERRTGSELLSAMAIDDSGKYVGVGTIAGGILIYSSDLKLLCRVPGVHAVFVTGLTFVPLATKPCSSAGKQVSRPDKLVLVSVSADRTCSATLVGRKSGTFTFIVLFVFISLFVLMIAIATNNQKLW